MQKILGTKPVVDPKKTNLHMIYFYCCYHLYLNTIYYTVRIYSMTSLNNCSSDTKHSYNHQNFKQIVNNWLQNQLNKLREVFFVRTSLGRKIS